jgi:type VI protein secretion system component Hcp
VAYVAILQAYDRNGAAQFPGSSSVKDHRDWVELLSYNFGAPRSGANRFKPSLNFSFAGPDAAAQVISTACAAGTTYDHATLQVYKVGETTKEWYLQIEFRKATVSSLSISGNPSPSETPTASGSLDYGEQLTVYRITKSKDSDFGDESTFDAASP